MTRKDMGEKLLAAVRAAKTQSGAAPVAQPPRTRPQRVQPQRARPLSGVSRGARQSDRAPPPNLDDPWRDLFPKRIWPD